jgi:glycerol-3-phosphate dehydrogenase (NAD(P)+)
MPKIAIIGTTTWGITLGTVFASKEQPITIWARTEKEALELMHNGPDSSRFPKDFTLPSNIAVTGSLGEALEEAKAVVLAVPSQTMRQNIKAVSPHLKRHMFIVSAAKGLEMSSRKRMSEVIAEEINPKFHSNICVLSGPNLAWEIMKGQPAVTVIAAEKESKAKKALKMLSAPNFCAYTNSDVIGVELGGALKNIIALGAGIADGLGYGDNFRAALITRGLTEISALGTSLGANPLTFSGLAGLGDLIATCSSPLSRNHYVGTELTKGRSLTDITSTMNQVAEGVTTTMVVWKMAQEMELEMPITEKIFDVLYNNADPRKAALALMEITAGHELVGRKWRLFTFFKRLARSDAGQNNSN